MWSESTRARCALLVSAFIATMISSGLGELPTTQRALNYCVVFDLDHEQCVRRYARVRENLPRKANVGLGDVAGQTRTKDLRLQLAFQVGFQWGT